MKKLKSRESSFGGGAFATMGKAPLAVLQVWAEGALSGGSHRLMAGITVAASCVCLYALFTIVSSHYPVCWDTFMQRRTPDSIASVHEASTHRRHIALGRATAMSPVTATNLTHLVFGIAATSRFWETRKEYIKLWWKPEQGMRGFVWLETEVKCSKRDARAFPPLRISSNTSHFKYTNKLGSRSAIRISRIVSETFRVGLPNVRWFVMGDDDTVFVTENLVKLLSKYDHRQFYYIGSNSESHPQNLAFSYKMAYGGGGFAISYPLAKVLEEMQDSCLQRYPQLFGSDDRIHACMTELGVPLTKEVGFHQFDIRGNAFGMLAAHPLTPIISVHHLDALDPVFPNKTKLEALRHLTKAVEKDAPYFLQQSICYDTEKKWSISVSWGYVVQVFRGLLTPLELEMPSRTFYNWNKRAEYTSFSFNSRPFFRHPCQKPFRFYMSNINTSSKQVGLLESNYVKENATAMACNWSIPSPARIRKVKVIKHRDDSLWSKVPRRKCCQVAPSSSSTFLQIDVHDCYPGEVVAGSG